MSRVIDAVRQIISGWILVVARGLNRVSGGRVHPNTVTLIGLVMHLPIALLIAGGEYWLLAGVLLVIFGLFDKLDGQLARVQNRVTNNGGFLDASTDRLKEVFLYTGAAYWLALGDRPETAAWAVAACGISLCVSYIKAKGEAVIASEGKKIPYPVLNKLFADGWVPFEIRMVLLILGLLTGQLLWAVVAITVLAGFTCLQRLVRISKALR